MARARRGGPKKTKEKVEKKPKEKKQKAARVEVVDEMDEEEPDQLPAALVILTAACLVIAIVLAWMQLGKYGAGPFTS